MRTNLSARLARIEPLFDPAMRDAAYDIYVRLLPDADLLAEIERLEAAGDVPGAAECGPDTPAWLVRPDLWRQALRKAAKREMEI